MRLEGKHGVIEDITLEAYTIEGKYVLDDFISLDNIFIEKSMEEMAKPAPKVYSYFIKNKNNEIKGIISFSIIGMINEFKLAQIHFVSDDEALLIEGLDLILDWQIRKNSMLKIIAREASQKENEILLHEKFVPTSFKDGTKGFKLTKPLFLGR